MLYMYKKKMKIVMRVKRVGDCAMACGGRSAGRLLRFFTVGSVHENVKEKRRGASYPAR